MREFKRELETLEETKRVEEEKERTGHWAFMMGAGGGVCFFMKRDEFQSSRVTEKEPTVQRRCVGDRGGSRRGAKTVREKREKWTWRMSLVSDRNKKQQKKEDAVGGLPPKDRNERKKGRYVGYSDRQT